MIPAGVLGVSRREPVAAGGAAATFVAGYESAADASTYTFPASSLGIPSSDRVLVVFVGAVVGGASVASVTIGGVSATKVDERRDQATTATHVLAEPSGTAADIVVDFGGSTVSECLIQIYALTGVDPTPFNIANAGNGSGVTVTTAADGVVVAASTNKTSGDPECAWSGVSLDYYANVNDSNASNGEPGLSCGSLEGTSAGSLGVSATWVEQYSPHMTTVAVAFEPGSV